MRVLYSIYWLFRVPVIMPVMFFYSLYVVHRITEDSEMEDLEQIKTPEGLKEVLEPYVEEFYLRNTNLLHLISTIVWILITQALWT